MHFSAITSAALLLAGASAQSYLVERDPNFKSMLSSAWRSLRGGAAADAGAYSAGFQQGYGKRDLQLRDADARNWLNSLLKWDAQAMGTVQGSATKAFLGSRDLEHEIYARDYDDEDLHARDPNWWSVFNQGATAVEKSLGTVAGKLGRTMVGGAFSGGNSKRDLEDILAEELYIRSLFEEDMFDEEY